VGGLAVPTPPGVELRPLARDDFDDALRLVRELYGLPATDPEPHRPRFESLVNDPDAAPFLAAAGGEAVGMIAFRFRRRLNHATFEGWVSDLVVTAAHRGRGIGRALLNAAIAEWRLRRGHQIMLEVGYERSAARALYEAVGFEERGTSFEIVPVVARAIRPADGVEIREISDDDTDFAAVTRLLAELGRPAPSEERLPVLRRVYAQHVARADTASVLAVDDGAPVGFCSLEFREPFYTVQPLAWIPDLIVSEPARGRDIGAAMLDAALTEAVRRGAYGTTLESGRRRAIAHQLYAAAGMVDVGSYFVLAR
jgi:ribosomal protein S18 acetylase RimI-like enzyme